MKKKTPRSSQRRAGLADGWKTVAPVAGMPTMGRDHRQKRSPKERSAVSGTVIQVSQVALDRLGSSHHQTGTSRRHGSGQQDRGRHGDSLAALAGAVVTMPSDNTLQPAMIFLSTTTVFVFSSDAKRKMKITRTMIEADPTLLREILDYDPETGALTWRTRGREWFAKDRDVAGWNSRYAGKPAFVVLDTRGYLNGKIFSKRYFSHRVIWALVHGAWPEQVDHIDGYRTNNRLANLRDVSNAENGQNRKLPVSNTSGVIGVVWHKEKQRWQAQIGVNGRMICIGRFIDFDDAVAARKAAEVAHGYHENHGREVAA